MDITITNDIDEIRNRQGKDSASITITGDICAKKGVSDLILSNRFNDLFNDFIPLFKLSDISLTNLESPLTKAQKPIVKTGPALKGPVETAGALKFAGIDVACLANNHILDYGGLGLTETISVLEDHGIRHTGAGMSLQEAEKPLILERKGYKIAFINITEKEFSIASEGHPGAAPLDEIANFYQITEARRHADFVIMIVHGGHEMYTLPSPEMVRTYRFFADLGLNAVIGHHAHVYTGYEIYKGVPIFYGLGNFLFESKLERNEFWFRGFAVHLIINKEGIDHIHIIPYVQFEVQEGVRFLRDKEMKSFENQIKNYNLIIGDSARLEQEFAKFLKKMRPYYLSILLGYGRVFRKMIRHNFLTGLFIKKRKLVDQLNLIDCQAHREAIIEILKHETKLK